MSTTSGTGIVVVGLLCGSRPKNTKSPPSVSQAEEDDLAPVELRNSRRLSSIPICPGVFAESVRIDYTDESLVNLPNAVDVVTSASLYCRFAIAF